MTKNEQSKFIKELAQKEGFFLCGISKAQKLEEEANKLEAWLNSGYQGKMSYLENHFDIRVNPALLVPGAKSVLSLAYNYYTDQHQYDIAAPKISKYAYGKDYHKVVRKKLKNVFHSIKAQFGDVQGRVFVDSAPILERDIAKKAGIGWVGKNTLLINPKKGSYFFLAEIIIDLELAYDNPIKDYCGTCTKCIDACPTEALHKNGYLLDASKCISYLTIELKDAIPEKFKDKMGNWMFGCDICQDVCPWNRFSEPHNEPTFAPKADLLFITKEEWKTLSEPTFDRIFEGSAVKRTKYEGLKRNIRFLD